MRQVTYQPTDLETKLRTVLEASPKETFSMAQLAERLAVAPDQVREALWNLYHRGQAEPVQPSLNTTLEQRWKVAERQKDRVKNRDLKWRVTASGSVLEE